MKLLSALRRVRFPDPLTLLTACVLLGAAASWVVPAGEYARHEDAVTGRMVVVAGTYAAVDPAPVGLFEALLAIPRGLIAAAERQADLGGVCQGVIGLVLVGESLGSRDVDVRVRNVDG